MEKKRFPADTTLKSLTFLNNKKVNGELYACLQGMSKYHLINAEEQIYQTYVLKKDMPAQSKICEILGIKSPKTLRTHLNNLIEEGYVVDASDRYVLPLAEDIYFLIPLSTLQYLNDNCRDHVIKIYIYLGQKYKYALSKGEPYVFTLEELGEHVGIKVKNNSRAYAVINNALKLLENSGLIEYVEYFDGQSQRKKLLKFSLEFLDKERSR